MIQTYNLLNVISTLFPGSSPRVAFQNLFTIGNEPLCGVSHTGVSAFRLGYRPGRLKLTNRRTSQLAFTRSFTSLTLSATMATCCVDIFSHSVTHLKQSPDRGLSIADSHLSHSFTSTNCEQVLSCQPLRRHMNSFVKHYRPMNMAERQRRHDIKELEAQVGICFPLTHTPSGNAHHLHSQRFSSNNFTPRTFLAHNFRGATSPIGL